MSIPISQCLISRACRKEDAYEQLLGRMRFNKFCGHHLFTPCRCLWRCRTPTPAQVSRLNACLRRDIDGIRDKKNLEFLSAGLSLRFEPEIAQPPLLRFLARLREKLRKPKPPSR